MSLPPRAQAATGPCPRKAQGRSAPRQEELSTYRCFLLERMPSPSQRSRQHAPLIPAPILRRSQCQVIQSVHCSVRPIHNANPFTQARKFHPVHVLRMRTLWHLPSASWMLDASPLPGLQHRACESVLQLDFNPTPSPSKNQASEASSRELGMVTGLNGDSAHELHRWKCDGGLEHHVKDALQARACQRDHALWQPPACQ